MIPWLLVAELVCLKGKTLGELVRDRMAAFPASGEINSKLSQPVEAINRVDRIKPRGAGGGSHRWHHDLCRLAL